LADGNVNFQAIVAALELADERHELAVSVADPDSHSDSDSDSDSDPDALRSRLQKLRFFAADVLSLAAGNKSFQKSIDRVAFAQIVPLFEAGTAGRPTQKMTSSSSKDGDAGNNDTAAVVVEYSDLATSAMIQVAIAKLCAVNEDVRKVVFGDEEQEEQQQQQQGGKTESDNGNNEEAKPSIAVSEKKVKLQITKLFVTMLRSAQDKDEKSLCFAVEALSYFAVFPWVKGE
jgi:hypothetical protein